MSSQWKISHRIYIKGTLTVESPLIIGCGQDERSDTEMIRDWDQTPFIPATSIAGAFRNYLAQFLSGNDTTEHPLVRELFGEKHKDSTQSMLTMYDCVPSNGKAAKIRVRDCVAIDRDKKIAMNQAKFDFEALEPGQELQFRCEVVVRDPLNEHIQKIIALMGRLVHALKNSQIALGAKTQRGFGIVKLKDESTLFLTMPDKDHPNPDHVQQWIRFGWNADWDKNYSIDLTKTTQELPFRSHLIKNLFKGELHAVSPLIVGTGENDTTDNAIMRDHQGKPFLPGTSLAGVCRDYLHDHLSERRWLISFLFGTIDKTSKSATRSMIRFYDATLIGAAEIVKRDGVAIEHVTRTALDTAKFDYEVVEPPAIFNFRLELTIDRRAKTYQDELKRRMNDTPDKSTAEKMLQDDIEQVMAILFAGLKEGKIRIGAKTRRGFGRMKLKSFPNIFRFDLSNATELNEWLSFSWDLSAKGNRNYKQLIHLSDGWGCPVPLTTLTVDFKIPYSIMVRRYHEKDDDLDASQFTCNNLPVIPGTSWAGALRHTVKTIGRILNYSEQIDGMITDLFGTAGGTSGGTDIRASRIFVEESVIKNTTKLTYTRNKIDRFTGGTVDSALFTTQPVYQGSVRLMMSIRSAMDAEIGLILLGIKEFSHGISTIGGDANVGRGILEEGKVSINGQVLTPEQESQYLKALKEHLSNQCHSTQPQPAECV